MHMRPRKPLRPGSRRWYDSWARYLAVFTVLVTLVTTTIVFFAAPDELSGVRDLVITCIALVGLVIALQLEILFRVSERAQTRDRYGRLLEAFEDFPDLLPVIARIVEASVVTFRTTSTPEFTHEVFNVLAHASARVYDLSQGRMRADGLDNTLVFRRFGEAKSKIQGTTDSIDTRWWRTDDGERFLQQNDLLIRKHGVEVERVWFLKEPLKRDVLDLLEEHRKLGIRLFVLRVDQGDIDRRLLDNFTLMDGAFLQQNVNNREGKAVEYLYSENHADLERAKNLFAQLKSRATEYRGVESLRFLFDSIPQEKDV
jgi:hypothetical protein